MIKPIHLSNHAKSYMVRRGFTEAEVEEVIRVCPWEPAELQRLQAHKDFAYGQEWNGKLYATKQVRPIFVEEEFAIVVITVYTYFF